MRPKGTSGGFLFLFLFLEDKVCDVLVPFFFFRKSIQIKRTISKAVSFHIDIGVEEHSYRHRHVPAGLMRWHLCSVTTHIPTFDTIFFKS